MNFNLLSETILTNTWLLCQQKTYSFYSSHLIYLVKFGILVCPFMWMQVCCMCLKIMWMVVIQYVSFMWMLVILFVNVMGKKILQPIFVNAGNFVNVLEKELLQTKYPYVLGHICKCWSFHLVKSWGNNYCNLSTNICKC